MFFIRGSLFDINPKNHVFLQQRLNGVLWKNVLSQILIIFMFAYFGFYDYVFKSYCDFFGFEGKTLSKTIDHLKLFWFV